MCVSPLYPLGLAVSSAIGCVFLIFDVVFRIVFNDVQEENRTDTTGTDVNLVAKVTGVAAYTCETELRFRLANEAADSRCLDLGPLEPAVVSLASERVRILGMSFHCRVPLLVVCGVCQRYVYYR